MVANKTSFICQNYQAAVGTGVLIAVDSVSYYFGSYPEGISEFKPPEKEQPISEYYNYASREGLFTLLDELHENYTVEYSPIDATFLARFLGLSVDAVPLTMSALDAGMKYPITIRHQKMGGTVPQNKNIVDAYSVAITMLCELDEQMRVAEEFAWGSIEDINDNVNLTTLPLAAGGCNVAGTYFGKPYCTWNVTHRPEITRVFFQCKQKHTRTFAPATGIDTVHLYEYTDRMAVVNGIFETEADSDIMHEDFLAGTARAFKFKVYKPDIATYIECTFANCVIIKYEEKGVRTEGHYEAQITIRLGAMTVAANESATADGIVFATFYKDAAL